MRLHRVDSLKKEAIELKRIASIGPALEKLREAKILEHHPSPGKNVVENASMAVAYAEARLEKHASMKSVEAVESVSLTPADLEDADLLSELAKIEDEVGLPATFADAKILDNSQTQDMDLAAALLGPLAAGLVAAEAIASPVSLPDDQDQSEAAPNSMPEATTGSEDDSTCMPEFEVGTTDEIASMLSHAFPGFELPALRASVCMRAAGPSAVRVSVAFEPDLFALGMMPESAQAIGCVGGEETQGAGALEGEMLERAKPRSISSARPSVQTHSIHPTPTSTAPSAGSLIPSAATAPTAVKPRDRCESLGVHLEITPMSMISVAVSIQIGPPAAIGANRSGSLESDSLESTIAAMGFERAPPPSDELYNLLGALCTQLQTSDFLATHPPLFALRGAQGSSDTAAAAAAASDDAAEWEMLPVADGEAGGAANGELHALLGTLCRQLRASESSFETPEACTPQCWEEHEIVPEADRVPLAKRHIYSREQLLQIGEQNRAARDTGVLGAQLAQRYAHLVPDLSRKQKLPRSGDARLDGAGRLPLPASLSVPSQRQSASVPSNAATSTAESSRLPHPHVAPKLPSEGPPPAAAPPPANAFVWNPAYLSARVKAESGQESVSPPVVHVAAIAAEPTAPAPNRPRPSDDGLSNLLAGLSAQLDGAALPKMPEPSARTPDSGSRLTSWAGVAAPRQATAPHEPAHQAPSMPVATPSMVPPAVSPAPPSLPAAPNAQSQHLMSMLGIGCGGSSCAGGSSSGCSPWDGASMPTHPKGHVASAPSTPSLLTGSGTGSPGAVSVSPAAYPPYGNSADASRHLMGMLGVQPSSESTLMSAASATPMPPMPNMSPMPPMPSMAESSRIMSAAPPAEPPTIGPSPVNGAGSNAASRHLLGLLGISGMSPSAPPASQPHLQGASSTTYPGASVAVPMAPMASVPPMPQAPAHANAPPMPHSPMERSPWGALAPAASVPRAQPSIHRAPLGARGVANPSYPSGRGTDARRPRPHSTPEWAEDTAADGGDFLAQLAQQTATWHGSRR